MPLQYKLITGDVALVAATIKTCVQFATPATIPGTILQFSLSLKSITPSDDSVLVQLLRQTSGGTMTALTPSLVGKNDPASLFTGCGKNATVEPAGGTVIDEWRIDPVKSTFIYTLSLSNIDVQIPLTVSDFVGLAITAPQAQTARITMTIGQG